MERRIPSVDEARPNRKSAVTIELVEKIRKVSGSLDDSVSLTDLRPIPRSATKFRRDLYSRFPDDEAEGYWKRYLNGKGFIEDRNAPEEWDKLWFSLTASEKSYLSKTLRLAITDGLFTVGDVRDVIYDELADSRADRPQIFNPVRAAFIKGVFEPK